VDSGKKTMEPAHTYHQHMGWEKANVHHACALMGDKVMSLDDGRVPHDRARVCEEDAIRTALGHANFH